MLHPTSKKNPFNSHQLKTTKNFAVFAYKNWKTHKFLIYVYVKEKTAIFTQNVCLSG